MMAPEVCFVGSELWVEQLIGGGTPRLQFATNPPTPPIPPRAFLHTRFSTSEGLRCQRSAKVSASMMAPDSWQLVCVWELVNQFPAAMTRGQIFKLASDRLVGHRWNEPAAGLILVSQ